MTDRVRLTVPRQKPYFAIAHLVLGGLALRENLTLEALEDLQTALDEVLGREGGPGDVVIEMRMVDGTLETRLGPFDGEALRSDLEPPAPGGLGLKRVLDSTVDGVEVESTAEGDFVRLLKAVG